jgi:small conductance mechanosensitive channel
MLDKFVTNYGYSPLIGIILLIVVWILASWADRALRRMFSKRELFDPLVARFLAFGVRIAILVFASMLLLDEFGLDIATFIAALSILGFAVAIGLRQTTHNFFTGFIMSILKPYEVGDYIEGERITGVVEEIHLYHTVVATGDGTFVSVPNGAMWSKSIKNFSRPRPVRVALDITVERQRPFAEITPIIDGILRADPNRNTGIVPHIVVGEVLENTLVLRAAIWCDAEHVWDVQSRLTEKLREGITAAGVTVLTIEVPKKTPPKKRVVRAPAVDEDAA